MLIDLMANNLHYFNLNSVFSYWSDRMLRKKFLHCNHDKTLEHCCSPSSLINLRQGRLTNRVAERAQNQAIRPKLANMCKGKKQIFKIVQILGTRNITTWGKHWGRWQTQKGQKYRDQETCDKDLTRSKGRSLSDTWRYSEVRKAKVTFTPGLRRPVEPVPGVFTPLVPFVWVGLNTVWDLWCKPNSRTLVILNEVVSEALQVNSGVDHHCLEPFHFRAEPSKSKRKH